MPVVATDGEDHAFLGADEKIFALFLGADADHHAVIEDQLAHRAFGVGRNSPIDDRRLDEVAHHAGAKAAPVFAHAFAERLKVPAQDVGETAPGEQLVVGYSIWN